MQYKEEASNGLELYFKYSEGVAKLLTKQCAKRGGSVAGFAGKLAAAAQ